MVVSFESHKPMSFTASIDFMDEEGKRYAIPVTAVADNCLLTNLSFIQVSLVAHAKRAMIRSTLQKTAEVSRILLCLLPIHPGTSPLCYNRKCVKDT